MTAIDDLHVGNWIAMTGEKRDDNDHWISLPRTHDFSGEPCKIVAISLPFLLVWLPKVARADTIDVRKYYVQKLHKTYVKKILELPTIATADTVSVDEDEDEDERGMCPMCGNKLRERLVAGSDLGWHLHCGSCGFEGRTP